MSDGLNGTTRADESDPDIATAGCVRASLDRDAIGDVVPGSGGHPRLRRRLVLGIESDGEPPKRELIFINSSGSDYYMSVVSVSMPEELLDRIDEFAADHGYTGRSEVVREAARNLLGEFQDRRLEDRELMAIVTVLFDFETTSVEERMMHLRHDHDRLVVSNFHSHVGDHYCMELFVLEGQLEEISTFVGKIRATQDTVSVDYSVLPVDDIGGVVRD
jgi:CopG family nickel-responsive transcriptional regulator